MINKQSAKNSVTIAMVIDDEEIARQIKEVFIKNEQPKVGNGDVEVLGHWKDLNLGFDMIREYRPTVAIIGLCSEDNMRLYTLAERISASLFDTQVFMVGSEKKPEVLLKAMRAGVREYLTVPVDGVEILNAIKRIKADIENRVSINNACSIGVMSVKGGSGCTTVAVNLSVALRLISNKKVILVDICRGGDIALFCNLKYSYTFKDVLENLDRLDTVLLKSYTVQHSSGINVVPGMEMRDVMPLGTDTVSKEALQFLIRLLGREYNYVVFDAGNAFDKSDTLEVLNILDYILLIFPLELPALRNARQVVNIFEEAGLLPKIKLVVNRHDKRYSKSATAISLDDVVKTMNLPIFGTIANDYPLVYECTNLGSVLVQEKRKSPIAQCFLRLAELLSKTSLQKH